jgi:hypothetical protein
MYGEVRNVFIILERKYHETYFDFSVISPEAHFSVVLNNRKEKASVCE